MKQVFGGVEERLCSSCNERLFFVPLFGSETECPVCRGPHERSQKVETSCPSGREYEHRDEGGWLCPGPGF